MSFSFLLISVLQGTEIKASDAHKSLHHREFHSWNIVTRLIINPSLRHWFPKKYFKVRHCFDFMIDSDHQTKFLRLLGSNTADDLGFPPFFTIQRGWGRSDIITVRCPSCLIVFVARLCCFCVTQCNFAVPSHTALEIYVKCVTPCKVASHITSCGHAKWMFPPQVAVGVPCLCD